MMGCPRNTIIANVQANLGKMGLGRGVLEEESPHLGSRPRSNKVSEYLGWAPGSNLGDGSRLERRKGSTIQIQGLAATGFLRRRVWLVHRYMHHSAGLFTAPKDPHPPQTDLPCMWSGLVSGGQNAQATGRFPGSVSVTRGSPVLATVYDGLVISASTLRDWAIPNQHLTLTLCL